MRSLILLCFLGMTTTMNAAVKIDKTEYAGWPNCYRISNGEVELIVTTDVGPRVMHYGFVGGKNVFKEYKEQLGHSGESKWMARGGHRLWAAPESIPDTYALDNSPIKATIHGDSIVLLQPVEKETGLQKEITVALAASGADVKVTHRIENTRAKPRHLAVWALTQMAPGGMAIAAFPPRGTHEEILLPTNPLTMWAYTDFSDKRWTFTKKYIVLRNDPDVKDSQKTGLFNAKTMAAYLLGDTLFVKRSDASGTPESYPDFGCSFETYTDNEFLEMETLGPLVDLEHDKSVTHIENWSLKKGVHLDTISDEAIDRVFARLK
ncbi:MAG: hypothetical protein WAM39_08970 [Bryobacteraceae bacterium]